MAQEVASANLNTGVIKDSHCHASMELARTKIAQRVLGWRNVNLTDARIHDAVHTVLTGTAGTDDLALATGTLGTSPMTIQAGDVKAAGAVTRRCRLSIPLDDDYEDAETVTLRIIARTKTTAADGSCTVDAEVYRNSEDGTVGSDICATSAQSINSTTAASKDFQITATSLVKGDILDVRITIAVTDTATVTAVIPEIVAIKLGQDRR